MNDNGKTRETENVTRRAKHAPDGPKEVEAFLYVTVIGLQSARSLQHLEMLAALYEWDLLVMAERGHSDATWEMTTPQSMYARLRTSGER